VRTPAKILLFGEHIVLQGAAALALPWYSFGGEWAWAKSNPLALQQGLPALLAYLENQKVGRLLDLQRFHRDLQNGLYFDSDIPSGYGAGSSGALCAAIYQRYQKSPENSDLKQVKQILGEIEGFFHGASSGTDPLICYLDQAVLLAASGSISKLDILPSQALWPAQFFVIDTHIKRQTGPWVQSFREKSEEAPFQKKMQTQLIPASNVAIQALLEADKISLWDAMDTISSFHFQELPSFIPVALHAIWEESLLSNDFRLKICGAGGGGFILGLAKSPEVLDQLQAVYTIHLVAWGGA
jgi:mevalonate kinase